MQVSSTSNASMEWSTDAKYLIVKLISLDAHQRNDKEVLFEELYGLWKSNGLATISVLKD